MQPLFRLLRYEEDLWAEAMSETGLVSGFSVVSEPKQWFVGQRCWRLGISAHAHSKTRVPSTTSKRRSCSSCFAYYFKTSNTCNLLAQNTNAGVKVNIRAHCVDINNEVSGPIPDKGSALRKLLRELNVGPTCPELIEGFPPSAQVLISYL